MVSFGVPEATVARVEASKIKTVSLAVYQKAKLLSFAEFLEVLAATKDMNLTGSHSIYTNCTYAKHYIILVHSFFEFGLIEFHYLHSML